MFSALLLSSFAGYSMLAFESISMDSASLTSAGNLVKDCNVSLVARRWLFQRIPGKRSEQRVVWP